MKTNHQRNFKDKRSSRAVFDKYVVKSVRQTTVDGKVISASANSGDHCCGKRGIRRDVAGAKKYVRSRTRFHNKMALRKEMKDV